MITGILRTAPLFIIWFLVTMATASGAATMREKVDVNAAPWSAIGQVNNGAYRRCTGVLLSRDIAITAAHCLFNQRSRLFVQPQTVHFVLGYDRGAYRFQTRVKGFQVGSGYDPNAPIKTLASDWALLDLREPAPADVRPMPLAAPVPFDETSFISLGFARDRPYILTKSMPCRLSARSSERLLFGPCDAPEGYSGGPLVDVKTGELVGIVVARGSTGGMPLAVAISAAAWRKSQ